MGKPVAPIGTRPPLHAVPPPVAPPAPESPEVRMFRKIQRVIDALSGGEPPTPRVRAGLRDAARQAVDAYLTEKLAERSSGRSGL